MFPFAALIRYGWHWQPPRGRERVGAAMTMTAARAAQACHHDGATARHYVRDRGPHTVFRSRITDGMIEVIDPLPGAGGYVRSNPRS